MDHTKCISDSSRRRLHSPRDKTTRRTRASATTPRASGASPPPASSTSAPASTTPPSCSHGRTFIRYSITSVVPLFHLDQSFIIVSITPGWSSITQYSGGTGSGQGKASVLHRYSSGECYRLFTRANCLDAELYLLNSFNHPLYLTTLT